MVLPNAFCKNEAADFTRIFGTDKCLKYDLAGQTVLELPRHLTANMSKTCLVCGKRSTFSLIKAKTGPIITHTATMAGQRATPHCCVTNTLAQRFTNFCSGPRLWMTVSNGPCNITSKPHLLCYWALLKVTITLNGAMSTHAVLLWNLPSCLLSFTEFLTDRNNVRRETSIL